MYFSEEEAGWAGGCDVEVFSDDGPFFKITTKAHNPQSAFH